MNNLSELLKTAIEYLKGVGPRKAELLNKELNIFTYRDLLQYYPFKYIDRTRYYKISQLDEQLQHVQVLGRVVRKEIIGEKNKKRLVVHFKDDTGIMELVWFQAIQWVEKNILIDEVYVAFGKPVFFNGKFSISHPEMELYRNAGKPQGSLILQPFYSSTEKLKKFGLDSKGIQRIQESLSEILKDRITESLPSYLLSAQKLKSLADAYRHIHFPPDSQALESSRKRLKYEELFFIQLKLLKTKLLRQQKFKGLIFDQVGDKFNTFYNELLPFELTPAQKRVLKEIRFDTQRGVQMNRLLQGDVGSGKTVVALMTMLLAIDNGYQACIMAPTEILANQHYNSVKELVGNDFIRVELLTGSTKQKYRRVLFEDLKEGKIDILIGTHALIEDQVVFKNLGLVVVDEQHRFGVEQRSKLWKKNTILPHVMVMTATPIPRTLAMTLYGDLDVSVIDTMPVGRKPIKTMHVFENQRLSAFGFIRKEIEAGRQVYIVYPLIKESEKLDLLNLEAGVESISRAFPLPQYKLSVVHGKMKPKDKDFEMQRFVKGETDIMVATTVIEVGVNVPNASVMIIENAERFGLAQLHQLRGRVGRGAEQSYCILLSGNKLSADSKLRLETMVSTTDGFKIAETDLQLRGPGSIDGTLQSGVTDLKLADLAVDQSILQAARNDVQAIFDQDPQLVDPEHSGLRNYLETKSSGISWDKIS